MSEQETRADRLRTAAARVRAAWARGRLVNERGERCALGAILNSQCDARRTSDAAAALDKDPAARDAAESLHRFLKHTDGEHHERMFFHDWSVPENIEEWNDGGKQSAEIVASMMEKAAAAWEESPGAFA